MKLLVKYPTRGRPDLFKRTFSLYRDKLSGLHDVEFLVSADEDDATTNNPEMRTWLSQQPNTTVCFGKSAGKIAAINADMDVVKEWDVLLLASDDMIPVVEGYDDVIVREMTRHFAALDGALHFNDGKTGERLNTLSIMGRRMYESFGYIYHPAYISLWCDNEFMDVTRAAGKVVYVNKTIIRHDWVDATGRDQLHKTNEGFYGLDKQTYTARKAMGFPR